MIWLAALLVLAGGGDDCGAGRHQSLVGTHAPKLTAVAIGQKVRIVRPASRPPQDHDPRRLNIALDANEVVVAVYCG